MCNSLLYSTQNIQLWVLVIKENFEGHIEVGLDMVILS